MATKPQVVIDTNVWLSGLIYGGNPGKVIQRFIDGQIMVITAEELLSELRRTIINRFPKFEPFLFLLEGSIREDALMVQLGSQQVDLSRDSDDNKVIETALIGNAHFIISGDKDLLVLKSYRNIQILPPADFLRLTV